MPISTPDTFAEVLALPGLGWVFVAAFVAGLVRGFSGFGTAMIYMPVAAQVLPPLWAVVTVGLMDIFGPIPNIPSALRIASRRDLSLLVGATLIGLPAGLWLLSSVPVDGFRMIVPLVALATLAILMTGVRYTGPMSRGLLLGTGGLSGFLGGSTGQPGPPVILLYMASKATAPVVRASTMVFLFVYDILLMSVLAVQSLLVLPVVLLGLVLGVPSVLGNLAGAKLFKPGYETLYRNAAYGIIAASALSGLLM